MVTKKLFWEDPYLTKIKAKVTSINKDRLTLDQTIFYAFSGGQASDTGTINGEKVIKAEKIGKEIFYTLESVKEISVGDSVLVAIDWNERYRSMKLHFAAEIILELVYQNFNKPLKIGANISSEKARLDFEWRGNISEVFPLILAKTNKIIDSNLDIISDFTDKENERRAWEIKGFAKVACGGTHIKKTGEIGNIVLKRKSLGINKERIEIYLK